MAVVIGAADEVVEGGGVGVAESVGDLADGEACVFAGG